MDNAAELSLRVFFSRSDLATSGVYNVTNPWSQAEQDFVSVSSELGYPIEVTGLKEFALAVEEDGEDSPLYHVKELYADVEWVENSYAQTSVIQKWMMNQERFFVSEKLRGIVPVEYEALENPLEIIKRDLKYAKDHGLLDKFGF